MEECGHPKDQPSRQDTARNSAWPGVDGALQAPEFGCQRAARSPLATCFKERHMESMTHL